MTENRQIFHVTFEDIFLSVISTNIPTQERGTPFLSQLRDYYKLGTDTPPVI